MSGEVYWQIFPIWIEAFIITLVTEVPIFILLGKRFARSLAHPPGALRLAVAGAVGTCITHPLLWFVWPRVVADYTWNVVTGELLIALIETVTFFAVARPLKLYQAFIASIVANSASVAVGYLIYFVRG
jgi:hypothetical protein